MAFSTTNDVVVGQATKKDHIDRVFNNCLHLYRYLIAGLPFVFGGSALMPVTQTAFPSGGTCDMLAPDTGVFWLDSANLPTGGTVVLEAVLAVEAGGTVTLSLVNLNDAPDTPMVNITSTSATGARQVSAAITFASAGVVRAYGVKIKTSDAAKRAWAWGIRLVPTA